jgi:hypothetical protein
MKVTRVENEVKPLKFDEVAIREPLVGDLILAERISGKTEGYEYAAAVISQIATFDGQSLPPEEIRRIGKTDFLSLLAELEIVDVQPSATK